MKIINTVILNSSTNKFEFIKEVIILCLLFSLFDNEFIYSTIDFANIYN